jgi:hypothetical protein
LWLRSAGAAATFAAYLLPSRTLAATVTWVNAGTGNWVNGSNWDLGVPPSSASADIALINNGGTALIAGADVVSAGSITLGSSLTTDSGNLTMTGGQLTITNTDVRIGGNAAATAGNGRFDQSGGTVTMNAGNLNIGFGSGGAVGTYNLSGGSLTLASSNIIAIGNRGTGTVNQSGGILYARGSAANAANAVIQLGRNTATSSGSGTFTLGGGTAAASLFQFGNAVGLASSTNVFTLQGTGTLLTGTISILNTAANNTFNFAGGTLSATNINIPLINNGGVLRPDQLTFSGTGDLTSIVSGLIGTTTFSGTNSYVQTSIGMLAIDIAAAGLNDFIDIGAGTPIGTASLAGAIAINLLNGFNPSIGASFDILTADSITNTALVTGQTPAGNIFASSIFTGGDGRSVLRVTVIPEPASTGVLAIAGGWIFLRRRERRSVTPR